jgi:hypothetical protein
VWRNQFRSVGVRGLERWAERAERVCGMPWVFVLTRTGEWLLVADLGRIVGLGKLTAIKFGITFTRIRKQGWEKPFLKNVYPAQIRAEVLAITNYILRCRRADSRMVGVWMGLMWCGGWRSIRGGVR